MTAKELKKKYFDFFIKKSHAQIPSASVVPENDPTVLFTTAGMHPLVPYLLGESHPLGKRLVGVQKCIRTDDIDEVGDTFHHTFFEMLGNWSLGDYWKEESITWSYEFLTKELNLDPKRIWITCFKGDSDAPRDIESANVWKSLGIPDARIFFYGKKENWWGPAGAIGPCGPDSEIFYDTTGKPHGKDCQPGDNCGRFFEIWNNVFMQYNKTADGKYEPLLQKNVDTGMGVERTTAVLSGYDDNYLVSDLWENILFSIGKLTKSDYKGNEKAHRIIADHIRASCFMIADQVFPSNKDRGYILRRLIRRAVRYGKTLGVKGVFISNLIEPVIKTYQTDYPELKANADVIKEIIKEEEERFLLTLERGLKEIEKYPKLDGKKAFFLYETYGFPLELTEEIAKERGQKIDKSIFEKEFAKHKNLSRTTSAGMFKGGLADHSEEVTKLHTTTHLVHAALRKILGDYVSQKGSNITKERLRFDFSHPQKLAEEEVKQVENLVNEYIKKDLPVTFKIMTIGDAIKAGALHFFAEKYQEKVKVYSIGDVSREVCGGPHGNHTSEIGRVRISKQEKIGTGLIRIYVTRSD